MKADGPVGGAGRPQRDIVIAAAAVLLAAVLVITTVGPTSARFFDAALQPAEIRQRGVIEGQSGPVIAAAAHGSLPVTAPPAPGPGRAATPTGRAQLVPRASAPTATRFTALDPAAVFAASSTPDAPLESLLFAASTDDSSPLGHSLNATRDDELTGDSTGLLALASETEDARPGDAPSTAVEGRAPALRDGSATAKPRPKAKARVARAKSATARPAHRGATAHRPTPSAHQPPSQRRR